MANLEHCPVIRGDERGDFEYAATCGCLLPFRPAGREGLGESGGKKSDNKAKPQQISKSTIKQ